MGLNPLFIRQVGFFRWLRRYGMLQFRKRVLRRDGRMRLPTGGVLLLPRYSASATEVYVTKADIDWGSEALFARFAEKGCDFIDIGAHIGYYALYLAPLVRQVFAFEPDPRNLASLRANAALAGNVEVVEMAVSSRTGKASFAAGDSAETGAVVETAEADAITVETTTLDAFLAARPDADIGLIKTDIEGHDIEALRGMAGTVAAHQPLILTECDAHDALLSLCADWGYRIYAFTRDRETLATRFRLMAAADLRTRWHKMLFLVPHRLEERFRAFILGD